MQPAALFLQPDTDGAAQVESALSVLQHGDARVSQADRFLADIRKSPSAWPIAAALIQSPNSSPSALLFAANTVHARLRADWLSFTTDDHRFLTFALAVDGAARPSVPPYPTAPASLIYSFGRACGFALCATRNPHIREALWARLTSHLAADRVRLCQVFAAIAKEVDEVSTRDAAIHSETRAFCQPHSSEVITAAVELLQPEALRNPALSETAVSAAVACLQAWHPYGNKPVMVAALLPAISIPAVTDDVAETMSEIVGYSSTALSLLSVTIDGLFQQFHAVAALPHRSDVHHAIAEVACALSDGNADEIMEQDSEESRFIVRRATELLWSCLKCDEERAFIAAIEGWTSWISAGHLVDASHRVLSSDEIAAVVDLVVRSLSSPDYTHLLAAFVSTVRKSDLISDDDRLPTEDGLEDYASEVGRVKDVLLACSSSIGLSRYFQQLVPRLDMREKASATEICALLLSLAVAGEAVGVGEVSSSEGELIMSAVTIVLDFGKAHARPQEPGEDFAVVRRLAMTCVLSYAGVICSRASNDTFQRVVQCAADGVLDSHVCEQAARLLFDLCEESSRVMTFLPCLMSVCVPALKHMPRRAAELCVRAVALSASALPSHGERVEALSTLLAAPCDAVLNNTLCRGNGDDLVEVCRNLDLISAAMFCMNDNAARSKVFAQLRDVIADIGVAWCANTVAARSVCRVLETCVLPTLMDEDEREDEAEDGDTVSGKEREYVLSDGETARVVLAMNCVSLAMQCFERSGPHGELSWLQVVVSLCPHMLSGIDSGMRGDDRSKVVECLRGVLHTSLRVVHAFCGGAYDQQPPMTVVLLRLATRLVAHSAARDIVAGNTVSDPMMRMATAALQCRHVNIVREALTFWKTTFRRDGDELVWKNLLGSAHGTKGLTVAILCAAQVGRLGGAAGDAMFAMCSLIAGDGGDPAAALQHCLTQAFIFDNVPQYGLDERLKAMLLHGCVSSARSKKEFRQAMDEVNRVCGMAIR